MSHAKQESLLPSSTATCQLSIIDTTTLIVAPPYYLVEPAIEGHEWMNLPDYAFHIKHPASGKTVLFDLGARKDWQNSVPNIAELCASHVPGLKIDKDIVDILTEGGVGVQDVDAILLSHWHFDHSGDFELFPPATDLIVGPGFKDAFMPGFPAREDSPFHEAGFRDRKVVEVPFSDDLKIGDFQAHDYFSDGSLYLLNVPGHAIGHMSAIVRTTADTAVLLGGDVCHFTGSIRPSERIPLPERIPTDTALDRRIPKGCLCSAFTTSHPDPSHSRTRPFYKVSRNAASFYHEPDIAQRSLSSLEAIDADPRILVVIAHDPTPLDVFQFFPHGDMNDWHRKGWKDSMHWGFLNELPYDGKTVRGPLVDGLYKDGERIKDLSGKSV